MDKWDSFTSCNWAQWKFDDTSTAWTFFKVRNSQRPADVGTGKFVRLRLILWTIGIPHGDNPGIPGACPVADGCDAHVAVLIIKQVWMIPVGL